MGRLLFYLPLALRAQNCGPDGADHSAHNSQ
jgi:hypothetical protein